MRIVVFIIAVNVLCYLMYNVIFYRIGISRKLFINSTFLGTSTGFTFPFVAINYNLKNAVILYFLIFCVFMFFLNSHKYASILAGSSMFIMGSTVLNSQAPLDAILIEPIEEYSSIAEAVPGVEPIQQDSLTPIEDLEKAVEEELLGEYFDPQIELETSPDLQKDEPSKVEDIIMDVPYYINKAFEYKTQGRMVEALESFMHILKRSQEANTRFLSCIHIAAIYKEMDQRQQAEDILYYFIKGNKNEIDPGLLRQAAALLNS